MAASIQGCAALTKKEFIRPNEEMVPSKVEYACWKAAADAGRVASYPTFTRCQPFIVLVLGTYNFGFPFSLIGGKAFLVHQVCMNIRRAWQKVSGCTTMNIYWNILWLHQARS